MIIKFAHVGYNTDRLERDIVFFISQGYVYSLEERNVYNPVIKKIFLSNYSNTHDLVVMNKERVSVELVQQQSSSPVKSFISDVISLENKLVFRISSSNIVESQIFWEALGFTSKFPSHLKIKPILNDFEINIELESDAAFKPGQFLDAQGYYSLAFISNNVEKEKKAIEKRGIVTSDIENLKVGDLDLSIFFALGPQGELVEFYQVMRT